MSNRGMLVRPLPVGCRATGNPCDMGNASYANDAGNIDITGNDYLANFYIQGESHMFHQAIYKSVRSVLTMLLMAASVAFTFTVQAAPTDYDGVWDVRFVCEHRFNPPAVVDFTDVLVTSGQGTTTKDGSVSRFTLKLNFENGKVGIYRRHIGLTDSRIDWILKIEGELTNHSSFKLAGIIYRQAVGAGTGQSSADCTSEGVLRKPSAVSLAAKQN